MKYRMFVVSAGAVVVVAAVLLHPRTEPAVPAPEPTTPTVGHLEGGLPSRQMAANSARPQAPPENTGHTNLLERLLKGDGPQLTPEQISAFLTANHRNAESLLAAARASDDPAYLREAKERFPGDIIEESGFDVGRCCQWSIEITSGQFAGFPLQVAHLVEDYPKRKADRHVECWIVITDLSLLPREIREAAHLRWHVENNVFKRLSKQSGTKRFHFKDPTRFYSLLRIFCAAVALFDMLIAILQREQEQFKRILNGIKATWNNIFSQLAESFSEGALAGDWPND